MRYECSAHVKLVNRKYSIHVSYDNLYRIEQLNCWRTRKFWASILIVSTMTDITFDFSLVHDEAWNTTEYVWTIGREAKISPHFGNVTWRRVTYFSLDQYECVSRMVQATVKVWWTQNCLITSHAKMSRSIAIRKSCTRSTSLLTWKGKIWRREVHWR